MSPPIRRRKLLSTLPLFLSFCVPVVLYLLTCCRSIFWMDSTEFMLVGTSLGISHPPGYPLLTLITRVVSLIPILALPFRLNMVSGIAAAASCLVLSHLIRRLTGDTLAGLIGALIWAVSYELWQQATALEAYALQVFLVSAVLSALNHWTESTAGNDASRIRPFLLTCFLFGLTMANHLFVIWLVPALLLLFFIGPWRSLNTRTALLALFLLSLGLLLYIYVLLRSSGSSHIYWGGITSPRQLLEFITGRVYRYRLLAGGAGYIATQFRELPALFFRQFHLFWILAVPGAALLWRQHRRLLLAVIIGFVAAFTAALSYNIPDKEGYFLTPWFLAGLAIGCGLAALRRTRAGGLATLATTAGIVATSVISYPYQNRSQLRGLADLSSAVARETRNSIVFTDDYSLYMGLRWLGRNVAPEQPALVVSEHHLAFPWYLDQLARRMPLPPGCRSIAERLWNGTSRFSDVSFGELAKAATQQIRHTLWDAWIDHRPLFWFPRDFRDWPVQRWGSFDFELAGLTYRVRRAGDSVSMLPFALSFPGPDDYRTTTFRDPASIDVCRRFAATVNRRGMLNFGTGNSLDAIADFNLALAYFPDYPAAIENKGLVFASSGQPDSARKYLQRYLELEPHSPEVPKVRRVLEYLHQPGWRL